MKIILLCTLIFYCHCSLADPLTATAGGAAKGMAAGAAKGAAQQEIGQTVAPELTSKVGEFFSSSAGVATMSGLSAVMSGILYKGAEKQEQEAEENVKKIERIIAEFNDSFIFFCPKGRDDLTDANCYCYNDDGKKNPNRTKSQICQTLWSKNSYKLLSKADSYAGGNGRSEAAGCMTRSGQFDERCNCRKFVDSRGNNSCFKASTITLPNNEFGTSMMSKTGLQDAMKLATNSANGNPNFGGMNSGMLAMKAIDTNVLHNNMASKLMTNGAAKEGFSKIDESNVLQLAKGAIGEKAFKHALNAYKPSTSLLASNATVDSGLKAKIAEANKKLAGAAISGGNGLQGRGETKKDVSVSVSVDGAGGASQIQNLGDGADQKTYKIKNDINKDKGASLFEIISNRYINSGLRRLFDKE